jgi:hypothetical protein
MQRLNDLGHRLNIRAILRELAESAKRAQSGDASTRRNVRAAVAELRYYRRKNKFWDCV